MAKGVKSRRRYHSPVRAEQAQVTQQRILEAARRLFLEQGYAAATINSIAAAAEVSPETVYAVFGGKRGVLSRLVEVLIAGDDQAVPLLEREWLKQIENLRGQRERLRAWVRHTCQTLERTSLIHAIIRSAAASDPEAAALKRRLQEERLEAQTKVMRRLASIGRLNQGTSLKRPEQFWALASPELHYLLRFERGWPAEGFQQWLGDVLEAQLLPS